MRFLGAMLVLVCFAAGIGVAAPAGAGSAAEPKLGETEAIERARSVDGVTQWLDRYPASGQIEEADLDTETGVWRVRIWSGDQQLALVRIGVDGQVVEAWTGPQVGWTMARGLGRAFGRTVNDPAVWFGLVALFLLGLANWRRPFCVHNLDLIALTSFTASLWFFNRGEIFTSVPLVYPPLVYLLGRMLWIGIRGRAPRAPSLIWPTWVLILASVFALGFRVGLNVQTSNVIDVGYAGVIGAQRIVDEGRSPYGSFPVRAGEPCGSADTTGRVRDHVQDNGRCEASNEHGDTYGPANYLAYVPGYLAFGWEGLWDDLPAAHASTLIFDLAAVFALIVVGWRFGRARLAAILAFAWVAFPFTQYVSSTNANDALIPVLLLLGFLVAATPSARGVFVGLAAWTKFVALIVAPMWATFPSGLRPRPLALFVTGFALATLAGFWVLLLDGSPIDAGRTFWDSTFGWQLARRSPFSIWDWGQYQYVDLAWLQTALQVTLVVGAFLLAVVPRTKSLLQLGALTASLLLAFEITLTHWFYLYVVWFFPFVVLVMFWPTRERQATEAAPGVALSTSLT